ncbi:MULTISPECIES: glycosyltransferase [unclassified Pseudoalteromonas]|uniref:glycosyltransferase n=1 Tax=unclassified Pseudoalteromonas TaxID=194690 RepID=UPI00332559CE
MNKKILIVIASIGGGGAERVAAQLSNYFSDQGHNVKVCYWNEAKNSYKINSGVSLCKLNAKARVYTLSKTIKVFQPDVILSFTDVSNVIAYYAKLLARSKAIYIPSIHNDLKLRDSHIEINLKNKGLDLFHRHVCKKSDKVVGVSEGAKNSFIKYYKVPPNKCCCIYNPIYIKPELKLRNLNEDKDSIKIVVAGRLTKQKNYPLLLDVAEKLKGLDFNFIIDIYGEGELRTQLEAQIQAKNLAARVNLKGFSKNLSTSLANYDLFLMTSSWEGFGNVLVEALENTLPIISTDCPSGPREVLGNGEFGSLVPVNDSNAIVDLIVTGNYKKEFDLIKLKEHLSQFTLNSVGDKYLNLFNELYEQSND